VTFSGLVIGVKGMATPMAKTMLTIITVAIVTIDVTALLKPNNTMAPAIGVGQKHLQFVLSH
jgi:hypothetical protein